MKALQQEADREKFHMSSHRGRPAMHLAYDTAAKSVVAVWQLSPPQRGDYRLDYQAGVSAAGGVRFTLLSRF
jgi:hypothetical protein